MRRSILDIINSSPESRQSRNLYRLGRDAYLVNNKRYQQNDLSISVSGVDCCPPGIGMSGATVLLDGKIFCSNRSSNSNYALYNPDTDVVSAVNFDAGNKINTFANALLKDGRVFLSPSATSDSSPTKIRIYNPITNTVATVGNSSYTSGFYGVPCVLPDGRVFVNPLFGTNAAIFNPLDWDNIFIPPMVWGANSSPIAICLLFDGRVLTNNLNTIYLYAWETNSFSTITLPAGTNPVGSCLLTDGQVFILNNSGRDIILNPATQTFVFAANFTKTYSFSGCRTFADGRVLMTAVNNTFMVYDPYLDSYQPIAWAGSSGYRFNCLLPDGRMLMVPSSNATSNRFAFIGKKHNTKLPSGRTTAPTINKF